VQQVGHAAAGSLLKIGHGWRSIAPGSYAAAAVTCLRQ
jgi:hypothetical protein